jgi:hypothetical protein
MPSAVVIPLLVVRVARVPCWSSDSPAACRWVGGAGAVDAGVAWLGRGTGCLGSGRPTVHAYSRGHRRVLAWHPHRDAHGLPGGQPALW